MAKCNQLTPLPFKGLSYLLLIVYVCFYHNGEIKMVKTRLTFSLRETTREHDTQTRFLLLRPWPSPNDLGMVSSSRYSDMLILGQGFRKFEPEQDRQTDRMTDTHTHTDAIEHITTTHLPVVFLLLSHPPGDWWRLGLRQWRTSRPIEMAINNIMCECIMYVYARRFVRTARRLSAALQWAT